MEQENDDNGIGYRHSQFFYIPAKKNESQTNPPPPRAGGGALPGASELELSSSLSFRNSQKQYFRSEELMFVYS